MNQLKRRKDNVTRPESAALTDIVDLESQIASETADSESYQTYLLLQIAGARHDELKKSKGNEFQLARLAEYIGELRANIRPSHLSLFEGADRCADEACWKEQFANLPPVAVNSALAGIWDKYIHLTPLADEHISAQRSEQKTKKPDSTKLDSDLHKKSHRAEIAIYLTDPSRPDKDQGRFLFFDGDVTIPAGETAYDYFMERAASLKNHVEERYLEFAVDIAAIAFKKGAIRHAREYPLPHDELVLPNNIAFQVFDAVIYLLRGEYYLPRRAVDVADKDSVVNFLKSEFQCSAHDAAQLAPLVRKLVQLNASTTSEGDGFELLSLPPEAAEAPKYRGKLKDGDVYEFLRQAYRYDPGRERLSLAYLRQHDRRAYDAMYNQKAGSVTPSTFLPAKTNRTDALLARHLIDMSDKVGADEAKQLLGILHGRVYSR